MSLKSASVLVLVLSLGRVAVAGEEKKADPLQPPAELAQLAFFEGTWACKGKTFATPMGPEHATEATVKGAKGVGGRWFHMTYDEKKTAANPNPVHAGMYMGFDAAQKVFVMGCVDSYGGYCTQSSKGWNGDTLVFEGVSNGMGEKTSIRDTFVRKGASQVTHVGEIQGPDGKWVKIDEETCKKAAR
ncbi:MAG: DUF1579 domain-containing protein [Thermoanaerobaculia bacterium]|nr:DUF1579 domain-containing protein [Thermoanaerobaculia bacterium]